MPTNRLSSVSSGKTTLTYSYDAAGNVTNDGSHSYTYDGDNRLVALDATAAQYGYDQQNRRVKKTTGGVTVQYVWQGAQVMAEYNGSSGALLSEYIYSGRRMLAKVESGVTTYFLNDRLSMRLMLDGSGNVTGQQAHLPFGEEFAESGAPQKQHFTSYERESESGLDYAINRRHQPATGRFMQADPYQASGGVAEPQSWNRYAYAGNDPINYGDPSGLLKAFVFKIWITGLNETTSFYWFVALYPPDPGEDDSGDMGSGSGQDFSKLFPEFTHKDRIAVNNARVAAVNMTANPDCDHALADYGIPSLSAIVTLSSISLGSDDRLEVSGNIFDGRTSQVLVDQQGTTTVQQYFHDHNANAITVNAFYIFLGPHFWDETDEDKARTLIHEAVHLTGKRDRDFDPGKDQDKGSAKLNELIKSKCHFGA